LAFGLKLVLLLILPATVALFVLAKPIVALLFQHGAFTGADTEWTSLALRLYLLSLPLAAIDQPLVFAFYARKNTLTPNLVAVAGVVIYTIVALALIRPFGFIGLVLANGAQLSGHALIMLWLTHTRLGGLRRQGIGMLGVKVMLASLLLGLSAFGALGLVERAVTGDALGAELARVVAPGAIALGVFLVGIWLLRVREANDIARMVWARVRRAS
jgi:putative peptidoglycan lipid II flippase